MQKKHVQKACRLRVDTDRLKRIEVHQAHFDILNAPLAQSVQGALSREDHPLGPNGAVELVLDLQQGGGELTVFTVTALDANGFIRRIRSRQRVLQGIAVTLQAVVAHRQRRLGIALVTQTPHAQGRGVRQIQCAIAQRLQAVLAPGHKRGAHRWGCAEQVQEQKCVPAKITDQAEIGLAGDIRQRPVVVDAGNGLHPPAIAVTQSQAVDAFGAPHIGGAILADRNRVVLWQSARHAGDPQHFFPECPLGKGVHLHQFIDTTSHIGMHSGNQLHLRFTEIGGDVRVRQRRAQRCGVGCHRQGARG